jgi:hypothetical protein
MRGLILVAFFVGAVLVIHSLYEQKYKALKSNVRVEYRFIPRTFYEEQLSSVPVGSMMKNMFDKQSPWMQDTSGGGGS